MCITFHLSIRRCLSKHQNSDNRIDKVSSNTSFQLGNPRCRAVVFNTQFNSGFHSDITPDPAPRHTQKYLTYIWLCLSLRSHRTQMWHKLRLVTCSFGSSDSDRASQGALKACYSAEACYLKVTLLLRTRCCPITGRAFWGK